MISIKMNHPVIKCLCLSDQMDANVVFRHFVWTVHGNLSHWNDLEQSDPEMVRKLLAKQAAPLNGDLFSSGESKNI